MGGLRRVHRPGLEILSIARSQPGIGLDTEKRTVSSASLAIASLQELVPLLALGDVPEHTLRRFERLRTREVTPDMIAAGVSVLHEAGVIEYPIGADEVLVADIYRAMVQARSGDVAVEVTSPA